MKGLVILILLTLQMVGCLWYQEGDWKRQLYSNSSFLFTFLDQKGYVRIEGFQNSKILSITLSQNKGSDRRIIIKFQMASERYQIDRNFHAKKLKASTFFQTEDGTTYAQKEDQIANNMPFNVTINRRKSLELISAEGAFLIKLIDIEEISPRIYYYLWLLPILIVGMGQLYLLMSFSGNCSHIRPTLGLWSAIILQAWLVRFMFCIIDQTFYITDTIGSTFLKSFTLLGGGLFTIEMIALGFVLIKQSNQEHMFFTVISYETGLYLLLTYFVTLIPIKLWHCLAVVVAYEIVTIFYKKQEDTSMKRLKIVSLGMLYLFPCFIFPVFSNEIRYPQEEAELWWLYGVFYLVEVAVFLLKAGVYFKLKRMVKLKVQKQLNSQAYLDLQERACPLCLKEVEISEIAMSPAGEKAQVEWVQAECGHHFHKACVRQNMQEGCCLFDNIKWAQEFKNAAQK